LRIRHRRILACCQRCGERHEWRIADAHLARAA
jgi:hypothetical protein